MEREGLARAFRPRQLLQLVRELETSGLDVPATTVLVGKSVTVEVAVGGDPDAVLVLSVLASEVAQPELVAYGEVVD